MLSSSSLWRQDKSVKWLTGLAAGFQFPALDFFGGVYLKGLKKTTEVSSQNRRSPDGAQNRICAEYEIAVITPYTRNK
jgi:hypothetical protein